MGDVFLVYKVTAEDPEMLDSIEKELKKMEEKGIAKITEMKREPFVFGMELIKIGVIVPDKVDGAVERVEEYISKIKGVSSFNNESMTLI